MHGSVIPFVWLLITSTLKLQTVMQVEMESVSEQKPAVAPCCRPALSVTFTFHNSVIQVNLTTDSKHLCTSCLHKFVQSSFFAFKVTFTTAVCLSSFAYMTVLSTCAYVGAVEFNIASMEHSVFTVSWKYIPMTFLSILHSPTIGIYMLVLFLLWSCVDCWVKLYNSALVVSNEIVWVEQLCVH